MNNVEMASIVGEVTHPLVLCINLGLKFYLGCFSNEERNLWASEHIWFLVKQIIFVGEFYPWDAPLLAMVRYPIGMPV